MGFGKILLCLLISGSGIAYGGPLGDPENILLPKAAENPEDDDFGESPHKKELQPEDNTLVDELDEFSGASQQKLNAKKLKKADIKNGKNGKKDKKDKKDSKGNKENKDKQTKQSKNTKANSAVKASAQPARELVPVQEDARYVNPGLLSVARVSLAQFRFMEEPEWLSAHGIEINEPTRKNLHLLKASMIGTSLEKKRVFDACEKRFGEDPMPAAPTADNLQCVFWRVQKLNRQEALRASIAEKNTRPKSKGVRQVTLVRNLNHWNVLSGANYQQSLSATRFKNVKDLNKAAEFALNSDISDCKFISAKAALIRNSEDFLPDENVWKQMVLLSKNMGACFERSHDAFETVHQRMAFLHLERNELSPAYTHLEMALQATYFQDENRTLFWRGYLEALAQAKNGKLVSHENPFWDKLVDKYPLTLQALLADEARGVDTYNRIMVRPSPDVQRYLGDVWDSSNLTAFLCSLQLARKDKESLNRLSRYMTDRIEPRNFETGLFLSLFHLETGNTRESIRVSFNTVRVYGARRMDGQVLQLLYPMRYVQEVVTNAKGVDHALVLSLIRQESSFNARAKSPVGASGLMQVMPNTGFQVMRKKHVDLLDPSLNITAGSRYLAKLLKQHNTNYVYTFGSYNAGPTPVNRWRARYRERVPLLFADLIPYPETRNYVSGLLRNMHWYRELLNHSVSQEQRLASWSARDLLPFEKDFGVMPGSPPLQLAYERIPAAEIPPSAPQ